MNEPVLLAVNLEHEVVVQISEDTLIDDGEIKGLRAANCDMPESSLVPLIT
jgi:hypothetical protein